MPKVKRGKKPPPNGWEIIEPTLEELHRKMRLAENESNDGKRKMESVWGVMRVHHQRSRYIYEMYYKRKAITKEVYDYCLKEGYADGALIAKWKKPGYEKLCCLSCIQPTLTNFGNSCICRVPRQKLDQDKVIECPHCGCRGCASGGG
jgi:bud site selection protein 31